MSCISPSSPANRDPEVFLGVKFSKSVVRDIDDIMVVIKVLADMSSPCYGGPQPPLGRQPVVQVQGDLENFSRI